MIDMQDFDGVGFHRIDYDVGKWRQRQFSCAAPMSGPALVWQGFQQADTLVDCPHGWFREMRVVALQIVFDVL